jgi:hypothetical protein
MRAVFVFELGQAQPPAQIMLAALRQCEKVGRRRTTMEDIGYARLDRRG